MDNFIEPFISYFPNFLFVKWFGLNEVWTAAIISAVVALVVSIITKAVIIMINWYKNTKAAKDLKPYFDYVQVKKARRYFIPTHFQNISPAKEDEPQFSHQFVSRVPLIPFFLDKSFDDKKETDKYYLILADSGMGKTTFMINLFVKYHSFFNFRRKYKMKLFPFSDERILDKIKKIDEEEAKNTILLLDAFDEDKIFRTGLKDELTDENRFRKRMDEVIDAVQDFREVIITSRTQYFPGQEEQPYELEIPRYDGKGFHTLAKLYVSPFNGKEIKSYLNKKYGYLKFWNFPKKRRATTIINNSPKLMVRPMLLSYIDLLVESDKVCKNTYEIYETLIEKWLNREATKRRHANDKDIFKEKLHQYSQAVALAIYKQRKETNKLFIDKLTALQVAKDNDIELEDYEVTGQSLLTRDAKSNWKFAHKSILEYFIAKKAIGELEFAFCVDWTGLDVGLQFYNELIPGRLVKVIIDSRSLHLSDFCINKYPVTQKEWKNVMTSNPSEFKGDDLPVENVSWKNVIDFIHKLNNKTGRKYRLPSDSEWEFAARGGAKSKGYDFAGSNKIDEAAWYNKNSKNKTHVVGKKKSNELGLYDMSGNVWEWTSKEEGSLKTIRGGGWRYGPSDCLVSYHHGFHPHKHDSDLGFRLAHSL